MWLVRLLAVLVLLILPITPALADTTADVTVKATPFVGAPVAPTDFTVTWITDTNLLLEWTKPAGVTAVMIKAKVGAYPSGIGDGYQVYYGVSENYSDTAIDLDLMGTGIYYGVWSENATGGWSIDFATGFMEGEGMILIAIIMLCVAATYFSLRSSNLWLGFIGALPWLFLWAYTREHPIGGVTTGGFADMLTMFVCLAFALILPLVALSRRNRERRYFGEGGGTVEWGESRKLEPSNSTRLSEQDEYRQRVRRALHPRTYGRRR